MLPILWLLEGILVGFGAILPGVSGGALCVAFGMYRPIIETMAEPMMGLRKYGKQLLCFFTGGGIGFVGLSGLAAWLLHKNTTQITCLFVGLVFGTLPALWQEAGRGGRGKKSIAALLGSFAGMLLLLLLLKTRNAFQISANLSGFLLCGVLWGLSFIVPGLSSSTLLLFFDLYQPMLEGIAAFDFKVLLPLGAGLLFSLLLFTQLIQSAYQKYEALFSHCILGIVAAASTALLPCFQKPSLWQSTDSYADVIVTGIGIAVSFGMTKVCDKFNNMKIDAKTEDKELCSKGGHR